MQNSNVFRQQGRCSNLTSLLQNISAFPVIQGSHSDLHLGELFQPAASLQPRNVAIKVLRTLRSTSRLSQLRSITRGDAILGTLNHDNIIKFLGVADHPSGRPSIVFAWYSWGNASSYLVDRSIGARLRVLKGVTEGLCYLHSRTPAIVHGDIKGVNILVNELGEGVLCGFGSSQVVDDLENQASQKNISVNNDIRWVAFEVVLSEENTSSNINSDVWAYGCTFYELLLGMKPYSSRNTCWQVFHDIVNRKLPFVESDATNIKSTGQCWDPQGTWMTVKQCWNSPNHRPAIFRLREGLPWHAV